MTFTIGRNLFYKLNSFFNELHHWKKPTYFINFIIEETVRHGLHHRSKCILQIKLKKPFMHFNSKETV